MKLHLHERLARTVTAVDASHAPIQRLQQRWQLVQAADQVWQINVVGVFHAHRLPPTVILHLPLINPTSQTP
ncbi:hypothetical protein D3C73_1627990 [compost metagenome]